VAIGTGSLITYQSLFKCIKQVLFYTRCIGKIAKVKQASENK